MIIRGALFKYTKRQSATIEYIIREEEVDFNSAITVNLEWLKLKMYKNQITHQ